MLVAGDIGGTKTDLAIYSPESGPRKPLATAEFASADYPSLESILREFLKSTDLPVEWGCFDVAGPVVGGRAKVTNLPWVVDSAALQQDLGFRSVHLMNDLEATALAIPVLTSEDLHSINPGTAVPQGSIAVVAPGTGLGEAFLTWDGSRYQAHASEGGHCDFAPTDSIQIGLLEYLYRTYNHVSFERVCSGRGLPNIYDYLREIGHAPETPEVAAQLAAATDRTPIIMRYALAEPTPCPLCLATVNTFVAILGAECSNMALKVMSTGGLYLGGGIPPRIIPQIESGQFMEVFVRKGRLKDILVRMPIYVITKKAALIGAATCGLDILAGGQGSVSSRQ